jgi:hypothetical protein
MKSLALLVSIVFLSATTLCQIPSVLMHRKIDSLHIRLKIAAGTEKVNVLNGLALHLAPRYADSALHYADEALQLAQKLNYTKGIGNSKFNQGNSYYFKMDVKNALTSYFDALRVLEGLGPTRELGDLHCQMASYTNRANNFRKAMRIYRITGNKKSEIYARLKIPTSTEDRDSTYVLCKQNLQYFRKRNDQYGIYRSLFDLSEACFYLKKPEGLSYINEALAIVENFNDTWLLANAYHKLVNYYENVTNDPEFKTDYQIAQHYLLEAINLLNKSKKFYQYQLIAETYRELGHINLVQKKYKTAYHYLQASILVNTTFLKAFDTILFPEAAMKHFYWHEGHRNILVINNDLKQLYYETGEFKKVYECIFLSDSILNREQLNMSVQQIAIQQADYEDQKSRQQILLLSKENELNSSRLNRTRILFVGIGGLLAIALLIAILWIQRKRFSSERKALALEQKLLRAQMNPHFIFNSLYSIQNFIVTEKPDKASIYLSKFARLVRNILDNSLEEFVTLEKEISTIENYIELQQVRYAGNFEYRIDIDDQIDAETTMIPPMLAQPFIENAIEHGIRHRETPGHIHIRFSLKDHTLIFEVEDDGVGRQKALELEIVKEPGHRSMATSLTRERLANLNRKLSRKIFLEILDLKNSLDEATGTRVTFKIPLSVR